MMNTQRIKFVFAIVFLVYVIFRVALNLPALSKPRELADTVSYLRISQAPLLSEKFLADGRPFVFPLLLKVAHQNVDLASLLQLGFSLLAWGLLALTVSASMRTLWLQLFSFGMILALSLVRHLASWDYVIMTESFSISWFVLFLAAGIWLSQGWRTDKVIALCVVGFFFAFTRDTNAYILLMLAGLLLITTLLRWTKPNSLILSVVFIFIFYLSNLSSDIGERWMFPLNNSIGQRVLTNQQALEYFKACGMPVTPELMAQAGEYANGNDRAFYTDPALEEYRTWLSEKGKSCYMKWLISNPIRSVMDAVSQFGTLMRFESLPKFYSRRYDPVIPYYFEPLIYPVNWVTPLWLVLTLFAFFAIAKQAWKKKPLWGVYVFLVLPIFPHLFIVWHGDAMSPERHALSVGLQLALSLWIFVFLALEQGVEYVQRK
ncbi:MAG: hypothetical protein U0Z26_08730 [Anaerolineales bacterium]